LRGTNAHTVASPLWYCSVFSQLNSRCWEGEYFVFNPVTGHTHVFNEFAWFILGCCAEEPCSEGDLVSRAAAWAGDEAIESVAAVMPDHLHQLEQLGLLSTRSTRAPR
jgi:PqqD family protein of HPr-rel-A system